MPTIEEMRAALVSQSKEPTIEEMRAALSGGSPQATQELPVVLNEASDIPWQDRAMVKNFGGSEQDQIQYLQERNPDLEVSSYEGDIVARKRGEKNWKKLDPTGFTNPSELARDLLDVGYDVTAGAATSALTAAATLPAAVSTGGIGAIPTAMATSAATGAGAEYIRQKLGQQFGTARDTDLGMVGLTGALSGLTGGLLGGGVSGKQIAKAAAKPGVAGKILERTGLGYVAKGAAPTEIQQELVKEYLTEAQKGIVQKAGSKALSVVSGAAPKETLENAIKDVDQTIVSDLIESGLELNPNKAYTNQEIAVALEKQGGLEGFGGVAADTVFSAIENKQRELSNAYTSALEGADKKFDITSLKDGLEQLIEKTKGSQIPAVRQQANAARELANKYFTKQKPIIGKVFNEAGEPISKKRLSSYKGPLFNEAGDLIERKSLRAGKKDLVSATEAMEINNALSAFMDYTKSPIALSNKSAEDKMLRNLIGDAKERLQTQIYSAIDDVSESVGDEGLKAAYKQNRDFLRNVAKYFVTPEKSVKTLESINNPSMRILKERLADFDAKNQTNVLKLAELADVAKYFGDPSLEAISSGGATSTGKVLRASELLGSAAYAGGLMTGVAGVAPAAVQAGKGLGAVLASPAAVAAYLSGKTGLRRAGEAAAGMVPAPAQQLINRVSQQAQALPGFLQPALSPARTGAYSAWQLMGGQ